MIDEKPRESCGLFGIHNHPEAAKLSYFGLYALQHRGQESAGIAVVMDNTIASHKGMGLVSDVFRNTHFEELNGVTAVGHVRYSTTGSSILSNAQPFVVHHRNKSYAVAHNGNLVNAHSLKRELEESGSIFQTTMDSEAFLHFLVSNLKYGFEQALIYTVSRLKGAFSFILMTSQGELVGIKDPNGFRPLCLGKLNGSYVLASESCALDLVQAEFIRELDPGEIVIIRENGIKSLRTPTPRTSHFCIFEFIYFARPDSTISGLNVYQVRKAHGRRLAREAPVNADLVMPFPDSGTYAALGYSEESGIPFEMGMIRNHYVGRTFIQPTQSMRDFGVRVKLNPVKELLKGKDIIIIEDSIIRGTTVRTRVRALREIGVKRIHMRVSGPPHRFPCHYGIDFSTKGELIAASKPVQELSDFLGLDSLHYLSLRGLLESTGIDNPEDYFCKACFDGCYPVHFDEDLSKSCLEIR
ncbi:amidophosphoribosyltransferase [Desulfococcus multivorans]|jgi:amidophosphoribosyltransferase|uniref:Amidophosphoribosyltransferase n=2 Tax=Desulfococcus TaxID=896 RepID=S7U7B3_DESML|nr:amidophosphoribosyltransferase [Desulfococcus multivorans]AOY57334.1 PurF: amidophosphoribosyltransferase [Desulfococcus multivorans]AQU99782.1 amidophosphoribosyltransferase [Desulfococcus multivorans]EPR45040.1 amidophosphoribosyltransferase [Desulfococcus multivorans DSM 2059]MDX9820231.1 amidophosphoribosyltransferase [Desulfococcus multivorans]SKA22242.1 amidophosphoribosyltransferase [Desulfococcus multivorans DSM 2059]